MLQLVALRVAMSVVSLVLAAAFAFSLVHLSPTDPVVLALGDGASAEQKLALTRQLGLDQPILVQLWQWASRLVTGNLGESIFTHKLVLDMIADAIPVTISLLTGASMLAVIVGISVGAFAGLRPGTWADRMVTSGVSGALAMPSFWLALLLSFLFAVKLRLVPVAGYSSLMQDPAHWALGLVVPCFALSVHGAAVLARHMRGAVIDVMDSTFINAARARGTPDRRIIWHYALKNALVPLVPVIGIEVAVLLAISPVIEKVFVLPGMGTLMVNAVITSDFPLLQGTILVIAAVVILVNFIVDIALGMLDPRIRHQ